MFGVWNWNPADGACPPDYDRARLSHTQRQQVAWWDETAKKCVLDGSHTSKYHHRLKRDADGKLDKNGKLAPLIQRLVPKFQQRSDIVVGVAVVELPEACFSAAGASLLTTPVAGSALRPR
jgi:hypothetical protein